MATKAEVRMYSFPRTGRYSNLPEEQVQAMGECADETRARVGGELVARTVADDARDEGHPWHDVLPWDDRAAADAHRTNIVSSTISALVVTYTRSGEEEKTPAFFTCTYQESEPVNGEDAEYVRRMLNFPDALEDSEYRDDALASVVKLVASHLPRVEACGDDLEFLRKAIRKAQRLCGLI